MSRPLLLSCEAISKAYGTRSLFDSLTLGLFEGDQAGLVGPNGSGKSTLLKILAGDTTPDRGSRSLRNGVRVGYVPQDPVFPAGHTVDEVVMAALTGVDEEDRPGRLAQALGRAGFSDGRAAVDTLSGGWKKRLAIARELAAAPDILLMDEPTNHLDVEGILWLEDLLTERSRAFLVVSHDRYFLEHVATRMLELNRVYPDGLFEAEGRYSEFLARRDEFLRGQAAYQDALANTVRREIEWLRRGAKARSTKAKGRIKQAGRMIEELEDARGRGLTATAGIDFTSSQRRTRRLLVTSGVTKSLGGRRLVSDLDIPTLEVLEESLAEFDGALVLVTHDRFMLERVSTIILALDGAGGTATFADYSQWEATRATAAAEPRKAPPERAADSPRQRPKRLGYREQREWDGMEQAILDGERAVEACQRDVDDPAIASDPTALQQRYAALEAARTDVDRLYTRWAELEAKQA